MSLKLDDVEEPDEDSLVEAEKRLRALCSKHTLSQQELDRRERAAQRLKEVYSSIPWYKEQGEKHGDLFWRNLQSKAVLGN
jgi:hypothetical protein